MEHRVKCREKQQFAIIALLFFLSGAAGLIYEIIWERLLEVYFGVTLSAITLIVSAYMAGLGLGSLTGGILASRIRRVILTYGLVEAAIGIFGYFSPNLIHWIGRQTAGSPYLLVFLLSFALLLIPTFLMGMTLPLLAQSFIQHADDAGRVIGWLYGINTLGAGIGTLFAGYILIGWLGFGGAILVAVILNLLVGLGAILFVNANHGTVQKRTESETQVGISDLPYKVILGGAFLTGFINLGFEILWFRVLGILNKGTAYGFPSVLFVFLAGLALGGLIWGNRADQSTDRPSLFWKLQVGSAMLAAFSFLLFWVALQIPSLKPWISESFLNPQLPTPAFVETVNGIVFSRRLMIENLAEYFLPILILILPASLLMGGGLPTLDRIAITRAQA